MPAETVLNLPLNGDEVIEIILQRIESRLRSNNFLNPAMTYNGFSLSFEGKLTFNDMMLGRQSLVWDTITAGDTPEPTASVEVISTIYDSGNSPNKARVENDLPLPIEVKEGTRKVIRHRKIKLTAPLESTESVKEPR